MSMEHKSVSKTHFKAKAFEFLRRDETSGKSAIVTDKGQRTIEVRQYRADKCSPLERLRGSVIEFYAPIDSVAEDNWKSS